MSTPEALQEYIDALSDCLIRLQKVNGIDTLPLQRKICREVSIVRWRSFVERRAVA